MEKSLVKWALCFSENLHYDPTCGRPFTICEYGAADGLTSVCVMNQIIGNYHFIVRCRYNAVSFLQNIHERHPIARPSGRGMCVRPLWLIFCLSSCNDVQYHVISNRVITVLGCIYLEWIAWLLSEWQRRALSDNFYSINLEKYHH